MKGHYGWLSLVWVAQASTTHIYPLSKYASQVTASDDTTGESLCFTTIMTHWLSTLPLLSLSAPQMSPSQQGGDHNQSPHKNRLPTAEATIIRNCWGDYSIKGQSSLSICEGLWWVTRLMQAALSIRSSRSDGDVRWSGPSIRPISQNMSRKCRA